MTRRSINWGPWSKKAANNLQTAKAVLRIRIRRIRMFLSLLDSDPDPQVRGRVQLRTTMTRRSTNWGPWFKKAANNLQTAKGSVADPDLLERGRDPDPFIIKQK
jgi:hypothetical protein